MRPLTFTGFLQSYVRALSGEETLALTRLVRLAGDEPRLVEPMLLWAAATGRAPRMSRLLPERPDLQRELQALANLDADGMLERALEAGDSSLRPEYLKVWSSYVSRRDAHKRDNDLRLAVRERILELESQKRVTRYRMAKDLGLNPGNLHAYLAQADPTKLSIDRVAELVDYLTAA